MTERKKERIYTEGEIAMRLKTLPDWSFADGHICRTYATRGWKATLMVVNTIGHLAEAAWHHPDLALSYGSVTVKLMNHDAEGITDKDFELAGKIEDVVTWQPGAEEASALTGPPENKRILIKISQP
ncbi:4a-hydroxytetrahydrobiopterin dehydratase [Mesorhizobium sp. NBSH29]|uniref:4a-hydroxytetrahydrobiopterin dehydratase n=1 Tax=Mesorhizobium sp. NBSH29 TaxID=2654249 RepID=UPI001896439D|nr:4a-hydroxytetrahydrobiopterin dehydratase [Mesorhizobium sp. NBSH29]QPC88282.1 4a-hydroxytetrahydrobiopterin dehydratase [Mesorhizobium sp. NBSH29]